MSPGPRADRTACQQTPYTGEAARLALLARRTASVTARCGAGGQASGGDDATDAAPGSRLYDSARLKQML